MHDCPMMRGTGHRTGGSGSRAKIAFTCIVLLVSWVERRAVAAADDAPRINLAGTFNNWATSDREFQLFHTKDRYKLKRFWLCGHHEFKFVFDGSWQRHLGDAGHDHTLAQPGGNIQLVIPNSGEYILWLDIEKNTWELEHVAPRRPHAIISLLRLDCDEYLLDPSLSLVPEGRWLRAKWSVRSNDITAGDFQLIRKNTRDYLKMKKAGQLEITLVVEDGIASSMAVLSGIFGNGFQLKTRSQTDSTGIPMYPVGDDLWAARYHARHDGVELFKPDGTGTDRDPPPFTATVQNGTDYFVVYDNALREGSLQTSGYHSFQYAPRGDERLAKDMLVERVEVVGDFNNWKAGESPLRMLPDGRYESIIALKEGVHHYKILLNGVVYLEDKSAPAKYREPDGHGGWNSGVLIGDDAASFDSARPNHINDTAVRHVSTAADYFCAYSGNEALVTLRTLGGDVQQVGLWTEGSRRAAAMTRADSRLGFDYWQTAVSGHDGRLAYRFELIDGNESRWFDALGGHETSAEANRPYTPRLHMSFLTPEWAKRAVWYQIFPERFRNGTPDNDPPKAVPWNQHWEKPYRPGAKVKKGGPRDFRESGDFWQYIFDRRYGGDLQGVREKLGYLRGLGVTAIYFNPIFQAESLHKYDASDYRHIDDFFGVRNSLKKIKGETDDPKTWQWSESDRVFLDFLQEAHRQGFKVILDGVFNHVGRDFWAFKDVLKNGRASPYAGWFDVTSWKPFHYKAWDGDDGALPRLRHDDALGLAKPVRDHLFAVTRRWMDPDGDGNPSDGIDGWRLDVAGDINANFWKDWRRLVKSINPDAYIVAELWEESRPWLDGKTFDAVMNYPFAVRTQQFFVNRDRAIKPSGFDRAIKEMLGWYPPQVNYVLQNLFDSHDTDRVASMFMNPDLEYDRANRLQDNGPHYNTARPTAECYHRLKAMVTMQMTFLGAPMVYYGDEAGMYGADDPSDRKPMYWDDLPPNDDPHERIVPELLEHYRRAIAIRNSYPCLQLGSVETLDVRDDLGIYAYSRSLNGHSVAVVINNSDTRRRLNVPSPWPVGTDIIRLDEPAQCELVMPEASDVTARPSVKPKADREPGAKIEKGRLRGLMLAPRTAAVFTAVD